MDCVGNIARGDFPPKLLQAHAQYLAGAKAANGSGSSMCPIGSNAAFCAGWDSNNGDYGDWDCGDAYNNYTGPFSSGLIGCPLDILKPSQMAKPHVLVGSWDYVNSSLALGSAIAGKIVYGNNGDFNLTIPNKVFGDYKLEGSWGYQGHNILTQCYAGGCENSTLITTSPNHIEFTDNRGDTIHLMR